MPIVSCRACPILLSFLAATLLWSPAAQAQPERPQFKKEIVAALDLNVTGAGAPLALAASIRLREELLRSGFFQLVDRQRLKQVLDEQAISQATCVGAACNIAVGRITGARIIVTGDLIQLREHAWQVSALMTDVETSEVLRSGSIFFEGNSRDLLDEGIGQLVDQLVPQGDPAEYGGVVNFLVQKSSALVKEAASGLLGMEVDRKTGEMKRQADTQYRAWVSPLSSFRYGIRTKDHQPLEQINGNGLSLGVERETGKAWVFGGSMHSGTLRKRTQESGDSSLILGYYTALSIFALDAVPNGHPWFYYGSGLFSYALNYADGGKNLIAEGAGVLLMVRVMHSFASGPVIGLGIESNVLYAFRSRGTKLDEYRAAAEVASPTAWGVVTYAFVGYTF